MLVFHVIATERGEVVQNDNSICDLFHFHSEHLYMLGYFYMHVALVFHVDNSCCYYTYFIDSTNLASKTN